MEPSTAKEPSPPPGAAATFVYRAAFVCAAVTAGVAVAFFLIGIGDGSVSEFNIAIWLALLGGFGAVLWAGRALRSRGRTVAAILVLAIAAVPGLLYGLFILLVVVTQPRWN